MASKLEYLKALFPDINFKVRSLIADEVEEMFEKETQQDTVYDSSSSKEDLSRVLKILEDQLRKAKKDYREAKRKHKAGLISAEELSDVQYYIFEIEQQIEYIKSNLK